MDNKIFYTEEEIKDMLKLSSRKAHALMKSDDFPSVKIGRVYRVTKENFDNWFKSNTEIRLTY